MKKMTCFFLGFLCAVGHAGPFTIVPKEGTDLPTEMTPGYNVTAYYTIFNNTSTDRNGNYIKYLPPNVSQVTTGGTYSDTCGVTFDLSANGGSGTLQLEISGPVTPSSVPQNNLFVCFPGGTSCTGTSYRLNVIEAPFQDLEEAFEIVYIANVDDFPTAFVQTYKAAGTNPIDQAEWNDYTPPNGYTKNTTRYLQFNQQIFLASPGAANGQLVYITTSDGYTWGALSNAINAMWPYDESQYTGLAATSPFYAGDLVTTPPAGVVKVTANYKAQIMKFWANENGVSPGTPGAVPILRYFITDEWGNKYIMHASAYDNVADTEAAFAAAELPDGWTKSSEYLEEDFYLYPALGADGSYEYLLIRDNYNSTYHQMYWTPDGTNLASQVQSSGMPIWGGLTNDKLVISNSFDNLIYGGGGVNVFTFAENLSIGINTIIGFDPVGGDMLDFNGQSYVTLNTQYGVQLNLSGGATVLLSGLYTFDDSWVVD